MHGGASACGELEPGGAQMDARVVTEIDVRLSDFAAPPPPIQMLCAFYAIRRSRVECAPTATVKSESATNFEMWIADVGL